MSERGSFITSYIYCEDCRNTLWKALEAGGFDPVAIGRSIIAGYIRAGYPCEEAHFMSYLLHDWAPKICHPMKIAVLCDSGRTWIFNIEDGELEERKNV